MKREPCELGRTPVFCRNKAGQGRHRSNNVQAQSGGIEPRASETKRCDGSKRPQAFQSKRTRRNGRSRSAFIVALETWRTETEGSHGVAKGGTRKKEEPLKGNISVIQGAQSVS